MSSRDVDALLYLVDIAAISKQAVLDSVVFTGGVSVLKAHSSVECSSARRFVAKPITQDFDVLRRVLLTGTVDGSTNTVQFCSACFSVVYHPLLACFDGVEIGFPVSAGVLGQLPDHFLQLERTDGTALSGFVKKVSWVSYMQALLDKGFDDAGPLRLLAAQGQVLLDTRLPALVPSVAGNVLMGVVDTHVRQLLDLIDQMVPVPKAANDSVWALVHFSNEVDVDAVDFYALELYSIAANVETIVFVTDGRFGWFALKAPPSVLDADFATIRSVCAGSASTEALLFALSKYPLVDIFEQDVDISGFAAAFDAAYA